MAIERLSIELTNRCNKACSFCYNHSLPGGETRWSIEDAEALVCEGAQRSLKAVSFGGGEPLQYEGLYELLERLRGVRCRPYGAARARHANRRLDDTSRRVLRRGRL